MQDLAESGTTKNSIWVLWGVSRVRRCLNVARVSAHLIESRRLFHTCIVDGRKESAYVHVFA